MLSSQQGWKESTQAAWSGTGQERKGMRGLRFKTHKNKSRSITSTPTYTPTRSPSSKPIKYLPQEQDKSMKQCLSLCERDTHPWRSVDVSKCNWEECAACDQCKSPRCETWCKWSETPWRSENASKCKWHKCSACDECMQVQECASWCKWNSTPWHSHTKAAKCKWNKCGACQECSTRETHQHSRGKMIPRWECPENKEYIETFFEDHSDKPLWDCSCCPRY